LTLLVLIIGFSFSMAIERYDQRKNCEEAEANAIGTEYVRAGLLPAADAARVRTLLKDYLDQRVLLYQTRDQRELRQINTRTAQLQTELWSVVQMIPPAQQTTVVAHAVSGMNDVLNSQGYAHAVFRIRVPVGARGLMAAIAVCSNLPVGFGAHRSKARAIRVPVLPFTLSISFFFIAGIDTSRRGMIREDSTRLVQS
jgi:hypothetical protein